MDNYRNEAAQISDTVEDQRESLSRTIAKINDFFDDSENILRRVEEIEHSLGDYAKSADVVALQKKVREITRDLNSTSTKLSEYVQRSELEIEIDELRDELEKRRGREIEFQKKISELEKNIRELEQKKKTDTDVDERIRSLEEKIAEFEQIQIERVSQMPVSEIRQQSDEEASVQLSMLDLEDENISDFPDIIDDAKDQQTVGITLEALNSIISRSSELKQKILTESITGLNAILERHGIQ